MPEYHKTPSICWDCSKCTGFCSWSESFIPVKDWKAVPLETKHFDTFVVLECPEFERDAYAYGEKRLREGPKKGNNRYYKSDKPTKAQMMYINYIMDESEEEIPPFIGTSAVAAQAYIKKYAHTVGLTERQEWPPKC